LKQAASFNEQAAKLGIRSARELVVLVKARRSMFGPDPSSVPKMRSQYL